MRGAEFKGTWRDYQAALLDSVDHCLADGRVHVVAAPGSGKTVLGLELVRRIGRPALVLAPTVTIRSQWVQRLRELFLGGAPRPAWTSTSLADPGHLTVSTYQALHAAFRPEDGDGADSAAPACLAALRALGPLTLVLDEAHHLRKEWWRALQQLVDGMDAPLIVSLTATPPYDVPIAEWQRYEGLCGPVDAEIAIPALVRNGDLCPHQDYVHVSVPLADEGRYLVERRFALLSLFEMLLVDPAFLDALAGHMWIVDPGTHVQAIFEDPEFLSAMLIALAAAGRPLPSASLELLGVARSEIPAMTSDWFERLLDGMLGGRRPDFASLAMLPEVRTQLQRLGAFEGGRVRVRETERLSRLMAGSAAKLSSILDIARAEGATLGDRLRLVVLTDHVRADDLPRPDAPAAAPTKLGVATIFEALRGAGASDGRVGVVSGSLVIVPERALPPLQDAAARRHVPASHVTVTPLPHCPGYCRIAFVGETGHRIVSVMTETFARGEIRILVGTLALLGEGWDAPSINSLVLASNVGSYMLSNQMRGRAIRIDPADPDKVANIWHLATVEPVDPDGFGSGRFRWIEPLPHGDPIGRPLGPDMELLKRRFRAFAGISDTGANDIESGLGRLGLRDLGWDPEGIAATNARTLARAADRARVAARWQASLGDDARGRTLRQAISPTYAPRRLPFADTLQWLAITGLQGGAMAAGGALRQFAPGTGIGTILMAFTGLTLLYSAPKLARAAYLLLRNGTIETSLREVGQALLEALAEAGLLRAPLESCAVRVERVGGGGRIVTLHGADRASERLFLDGMSEILGPIGNPRYLLVRESVFARRLRIDYHAVPSALGQRSTWAEAFARRWAAHVGKGRLVFTRNLEGRRLLLRARMRSMAAGFARDVETLSAWR